MGKKYVSPRRVVYVQHSPEREGGRAAGGCGGRWCVVFSLGLAVGALVGYAGMGFTHAMLELGTLNHGGVVALHLPEQQQAAAAARQQAAGAGAGAGGGIAAAAAGGGGGAAAASLGSPAWPATGDGIHVLATSNGSPYCNWQTRVMLGTLRLAQREPGGGRIKGFTRILHRTKPDGFEDEIPTWRAIPLQPECDGWCEYPVSDRANAVVQFLAAASADASLLKGPWLLMVETDYVFLKPPASPGPAEDPASRSVGFPYGYIQPEFPTIRAVMERLYPPTAGPLSDVPGSGPAPVLMRAADWARVAPQWERLTAEVGADAEAKEKLGWVREMYAFSIAAALERVKLDLRLPPANPLTAQPPADHAPGDAATVHYTWGSILKDKDGKEVWRFDKREYGEEKHARELPGLPAMPPFEEGWTLQDGVKVTRDLYDFLALMSGRMNAGIALVKGGARGAV